MYAALDWLVAQQDSIEAKLANKHLTGPANPDRLALFDLSSSWMTGTRGSVRLVGAFKNGG